MLHLNPTHGLGVLRILTNSDAIPGHAPCNWHHQTCLTRHWDTHSSIGASTGSGPKQSKHETNCKNTKSAEYTDVKMSVKTEQQAETKAASSST